MIDKLIELGRLIVVIVFMISVSYIMLGERKDE